MHINYFSIEAIDTTNDEEGLTLAESASPEIDAPGKKRKKKNVAPLLIRERIGQEGACEITSTNKKGEVTPQSTKKKITVHDETLASFPAKPSGIALVEEDLQ